MNTYETEQEAFWAGQFGDGYISRNQGATLMANRIAFFSTILRKTGIITSAIEFGANIGINLMALKHLLPEAQLDAVEINPTVAQELRNYGSITVYETSVIGFSLNASRNLAFTMGVLIHINPEHLPQVYDTIYNSSSKYILIGEYYNPSPVAIPYRGHSDKLFKRDFAGEMMDAFPSLRLVDYGFIYHRAPAFPGDDITWFLMEKCR